MLSFHLQKQLYSYTVNKEKFSPFKDCFNPKGVKKDSVKEFSILTFKEGLKNESLNVNDLRKHYNNVLKDLRIRNYKIKG